MRNGTFSAIKNKQASAQVQLRFSAHAAAALRVAEVHAHVTPGFAQAAYSPHCRRPREAEPRPGGTRAT